MHDVVIAPDTPQGEESESNATASKGREKKRKRKGKFEAPTEEEVVKGEDAFKRGSKLSRFRHAVLVQLFVTRTTKSKQNAEGLTKDRLLEELQTIRVRTNSFLPCCRLTQLRKPQKTNLLTCRKVKR